MVKLIHESWLHSPLSRVKPESWSFSYSPPVKNPLLSIREKEKKPKQTKTNRQKNKQKQKKQRDFTSETD